MNAFIPTPTSWIESVGELKLPTAANLQLQQLMDKNTDGLLSEKERAELAALAELSEQLSLVRAEALTLLGRKPE